MAATCVPFLFMQLCREEEYERDEHKKEPIPKKYFNFCSSGVQFSCHLPTSVGSSPC